MRCPNFKNFFLQGIKMKQRSIEWFDARKGKVTGSVVGAILGLSPLMTKKEVIRKMVRDYYGLPSEFVGNIATEYGVRHEETAFKAFAEANKQLNVVETGFHVSLTKDWLGASPDGLVDDDGILEIKCPFGKRNGDEFESINNLPHYYAQMQIEMMCTGRTVGYFYQWSKKGDKLEFVPFDEKWIEVNLPKLEAFYQEFLIELDNPDHLEEKKEVSVLKGEHADKVAYTFKHANEMIKYYKGIADKAREELIEMACGEKAKIGGLSVSPVTRKGAINYRKAVEKHIPDIDLTEFESAPVEYWSIK